MGLSQIRRRRHPGGHPASGLRRHLRKPVTGPSMPHPPPPPWYSHSRPRSGIHPQSGIPLALSRVHPPLSKCGVCQERNGVGHPASSPPRSGGRPTPDCHVSPVIPTPDLPGCHPEAPRGISSAPRRHGIHRPSPPSNFRECKGYASPFLKQSKPCLKPQNNQNPPPPPRHSRLRSGIHPEGRGRVPVGATGWSPFPVRNAGRGSPSPSPAPREIPGKPFRRRSIKPATSSINVQSMFNQKPAPTTE